MLISFIVLKFESAVKLFEFYDVIILKTMWTWNYQLQITSQYQITVWYLYQDIGNFMFSLSSKRWHHQAQLILPVD